MLGIVTFVVGIATDRLYIHHLCYMQHAEQKFKFYTVGMICIHTQDHRSKAWIMLSKDWIEDQQEVVDQQVVGVVIKCANVMNLLAVNHGGDQLCHHQQHFHVILLDHMDFPLETVL